MSTTKPNLAASTAVSGRPRAYKGQLFKELARTNLRGSAAVECVMLRLFCGVQTAYRYLGGEPMLNAQAWAFVDDIGADGVARLVAKQADVKRSRVAERRALAIAIGMALRGGKKKLASRLVGLGM